MKQWSQRRNIPDEVLNDFIELALSKANRALRIPPLEKLDVPVVDAEGYFDLPSDFIELKELVTTYNNQTIILERKAIHEVDFLFDKGGVQPCIFGRFGNLIRIAPAPTDDAVRMYYYAAIPVMPSDSTENWFTQYAPEVLLYGGMAELSSYVRDQEGMQRWESKFTEAVNILQSMEDRASWSGGPIGISIGGSH